MKRTERETRSLSRFLRFGLTGVLPLVVFLQVHFTAAASTDSIVVNAAAVTRTIPSTFFGINYVGFWDRAQGSSASAKALSQTPIRSFRFAGGAPADWYDWKNPYCDGWSSTSPLNLWTYAQQVGSGARALFQTNYQGHYPNNPPCSTYPVAVNAPQYQADWVTYNKQHGIQANMEVGNEEDMCMKSTHDACFQPYINAFNAQAQAMHAANSSVKVYGPVGTNEWYWWGLDSLGMFLSQTGNRHGTSQVDGVSVHYYKGSTSGGAAAIYSGVASIPQSWFVPSSSGGTTDWSFIQSAIASNDTRNLPVDVSEWNLGDSDSGSGFNQTLGHALAVGDMVGAFAQSGVAEEDYFDLHGAKNYGLLYGTGESRPLDTPTPTYYAMALWGKMGSSLLNLSQSANPASTVSAYATRKADGSVQVMAINKTGATQPLQVSYQNFNPQGGTLHVYDLTGATGNVTDLDTKYDGVTNPSPQQTLPSAHSTQQITGSSLSYTLPAYSVVVLDATPGSSTVTSTPTKTSAPSATPTTTPVPIKMTINGASASPSSVARGSSTSLSTTVTSSAALSNAIVDFEVYRNNNGTWTKVYQTYRSGVNFTANAPRTVTASWSVPSSQATGNYTLTIGVFNSNWTTNYAWDGNGATITVT